MAVAQTNIDREALISRLQSSQERYLKAFADITEARGTASLGEGCWSIAQIAEHVALVEAGLLNRLKNAWPRGVMTNFEKDIQLQSEATDRSQKRQAPPMALPTGHFANLGQAIHAFKEARANTMEHVRNYSGDFRKLSAESSFGELDGYQLILLIALHPERHTLQIDEIKNSPAYLK